MGFTRVGRRVDVPLFIWSKFGAHARASVRSTGRAGIRPRKIRSRLPMLSSIKYLGLHRYDSVERRV
jgi:hypothetical protein